MLYNFYYDLDVNVVLQSLVVSSNSFDLLVINKVELHQISILQDISLSEKNSFPPPSNK